MSINTNDEVIIAPLYIQEAMKLKTTGWAYALSNGKSGLVPLNYLLLNKSNKKPVPTSAASSRQKTEDSVLKNYENTNWFSETTVDTPDESEPKPKGKTHTKKVSFGENQIFENIDLDCLRKNSDIETKHLKSSLKSPSQNTEKSGDMENINDK